MSWWVSRDFYCLAYRFVKLMSHVKKYWDPARTCTGALKPNQTACCCSLVPRPSITGGLKAWVRGYKLLELRYGSRRYRWWCALSIDTAQFQGIQLENWAMSMDGVRTSLPLLQCLSSSSSVSPHPERHQSCCLLSILSDSDQIHMWPGKPKGP